MSITGKLAVIASFIISVQPGWQQQCSVERLPDFGDTDDRDRPYFDRFQAIVPAYRFNCSGRVAEWGACVQPGAFREQYYIQFQVWRPTGTEGCYELVGYNIPLDDANEEERNISDSGSIIEREGFLSPPGNNRDPLDHCVVLPVRESKQIDFMAGDVVGYYVDWFKNGFDRNFGGIQWIDDSDSEVEVHFRDELPREDIKSQYALVNGPDPTECLVSGGTTDLHTLSATSTSAPIISVSIHAAIPSLVPPPTTSLVPTPTTSLIPTPPSPPTTFLAMPPLVPPLLTPSTSSPDLAMMMTPVVSVNPSTSPSCSTDNMCSDTQDDTVNNTNRNDRINNTNRNGPIIAGIGVLVSLLTIIIATIVAISVLLWLRKRKMEPKLVDNVAYLSQKRELDSKPVYQTVSATNVVMDTNESYGATSVPTSPNTAYHTVQPPSRKSVDIATSVNEAYVTTDITTSDNAAYHPIHRSSDNTQQLEYDYVRSDNDHTVQPPSRKSVDIATSVNEAYVTTDITTSVNAAYHPIHSSSDSTQQLEYDYVRSDNDLEYD